MPQGDELQNPHIGRSMKAEETPLDPANQSLADALRTTFRLLKLFMIVLVVLFFVSGVFVVDQNEQAVVFRFGKAVGGVRDSGVYFAFPRPIDEVIKLPVKQSNTLAVDSHWLHLYERDKGIPLDDIQRGRQGLNPVLDGALLTGDKGLVHIQWRLTYRIHNLENYVRFVSDADVTRAQDIITKLLEKAAIHVASGYTTEDATRKRLTELRVEVRDRINADLEALDLGIEVGSVEIPLSTPPIQTRVAFAEVLRAESKKQTTIRAAEQRATDILNRTAGAAHMKLIALLDELDALKGTKESAEATRITAEIDRVVEFEASGAVGTMVRGANGYKTSVVQGMQSDAEEYRTLLTEYRRQPDLLIARLWEETKRRILSNPQITKIYIPADVPLRIRLGPDPRQKDRKETEQYQLEGPLRRHEHLGMEEKFPGGKPV